MRKRPSPRGLAIRGSKWISLKIKQFAHRAHNHLMSHASHIFLRKKLTPRELEYCLKFFSNESRSALNRPTDMFILVVSYSRIGDHQRAFENAKLIVEKFPKRFDLHEQAAIALYHAGGHQFAEKIWSLSGDKKEKDALNLGLHEYNCKFLDNSWLLAIGHIAHIDSYLKNKILNGTASERTIIEISPNSNVPNRALLNCFSDHLIITNGTSEFGPNTVEEKALLQDHFWTLRFESKRNLMFGPAGALVDEQWTNKGLPPLPNLSEEIKRIGMENLNSVGITDSDWFVCLHVREPGFHQGWHNLHPSVRNADIGTYAKAIDKIIEMGGWVIRVGDSTMTKLTDRPGLFDYAHSNMKSEEMDVFLCASCRFFIGTNSGLGLVPAIFGAPCALTNWIPIAQPQWYKRDRFLPKSIWSKSEQRFLSLREQFDSGIAGQEFLRFFEEHDLEVTDNSEDEILDIVLELLSETSGKTYLDADDCKLAEAYQNFVKFSGGYNGARPARIFLRKNTAELRGLAEAYQ